MGRRGVRSSPAPPWVVAVFDVPRSREDEVAGVVAADALGAELVRGRAGRTTLRVYFEAAAHGAAARIEAALRRARLDPARCGLRVREVPDGRWVERYRAGLRPFALGRRFLIDPRECVATPARGAAGRIVLRVPAGRAFGTGEHPTTRLCVEGLERVTRAGTRWLDVGCGTAILALVAARCGAAAVRAVDRDPQAVAVARRVVAANGLGGRVRVAAGSLEEGEAAAAWDGIVVNVDARFLRERAVALGRALAPGGVLVASGFLDAEAAAIRGALGGAGFGAGRISRRDGWAALVATRGG